MKKINKINTILLSSMMLFGVASCGNNEVVDEGVYTEDFVNALVDKYNLKPDNGKYVYTEQIVDHGYEYTYELTCKNNTTFSYIFNSTITRNVNEDGITGYITSSIEFLWGRFETSLFNAKAHFEKGTVKDDVHLIYYGLVFNDDGTLKNTCYTYTVDGVINDFSSQNVLNNGWLMTRLQVEKLNTLTQETCGIYLW